MRDFNYFDPYIKVQAKPKSKIILFALLGALALALIVFYQITLIQQAKALESDIAEVDAFINSKSTLDKIAAVSDKQNQEAALTMAHTDLLTLTQTISSTDKVDEMLVDEINAQIPAGLFVSEMNLNYETLSMKGYATDHETIAQFAFNLRNSGSFSQVNIPSVVQDNGNFVFAINATLHGEVENEN